MNIFKTLFQVWENEFLTWNQSDFCGIDMLTVPATRVWNPDLFIQEEFVLLLLFYLFTGI